MRFSPASLLALAALAAPLQAQQSLLTSRALAVTPTFESWSFGDGVAHGFGGARLERASQWSIPIAMSVATGSRWTIDLASAYSSGTVTLDREDAQLGVSELSLAGLADVRVRATGKFLGERLLLTVGGIVPTGKTELAADELSALRVLSAPALSFQTPVLGGGPGATVGLVLARPVGAWAIAAGTSFEYRGSYTPATIVAGLPTLDFSPGEVVHFSLGMDGLIGRHGATITGSLDVFGRDRVGEEAAIPPTRLGPVATIDARLNVAASGFQQFAIYLVDRYRSSFSRDGVTVAESAGNYLDAGIQTVYALSPRTGFLTAINARHQSGLGFDTGIQTAAIASGALTLGITRQFGNGFELAPFARAQLGRLESGTESTNVRGFAGGVTFGRRF